MSDKTAIEWTEATWNPLTGCTKVSPGCDHCYAESIAHRFDGTPAYPNGFGVTLRPERLDQPLRWKRPRRIFVNSMSDLFHDSVPDTYIAQVFGVMALAPHHTFQVLTKRHARMRSLVSHGLLDLIDDPAGDVRAKVPHWPLPNVWLGVSAENQQWADIRIPALLDTPAAVRFVSAEPLLGPIRLGAIPPLVGGVPKIDWVIVGGESGHGARPMHPDWARGLRDECEDAGVAFLFKQWGEWTPNADGQPYRDWWNLEDPHAFVMRYGKKRAGRELDGRTWDEYPAVVSHA
jgi:protein gp37